MAHNYFAAEDDFAPSALSYQTLGYSQASSAALQSMPQQSVLHQMGVVLDHARDTALPWQETPELQQVYPWANSQQQQQPQQQQTQRHMVPLNEASYMPMFAQPQQQQQGHLPQQPSYQTADLYDPDSHEPVAPALFRPQQQQQQQQQQQVMHAARGEKASATKFTSIKTDHKFDDYLQEMLQDARNFLNNNVLPSMHQSMTLALCPLQTPVQLTPHHREVLPVLHLLLKTVLGKMQKRVDAQLPRLGKINPEARNMDLPRLDRLQTLAQKYGSRAAFVPHIQNIITSFQDMQARLKILWTEHHVLHTHMRHEFEQMIRRISTQTFKIYQQVCPEVRAYIEYRRSRELDMHQAFARERAKKIEMRKQFYLTHSEWIQGQIGVLRDMLEVVDVQLLGPCAGNGIGDERDDNNMSRPLTQSLKFQRSADIDVRVARQDLTDLRVGLDTWRQMFTDHLAVDNHYAFLPELFSELQLWLVTFQNLFVRLIGERVPADAQSAFPLAPVQVQQMSAPMGYSQDLPTSQKSGSSTNQTMQAQIPTGKDLGLYSSIYATKRSPFEGPYKRGVTLQVEFDENDDDDDDDDEPNASTDNGSVSRGRVTGKNESVSGDGEFSTSAAAAAAPRSRKQLARDAEKSFMGLRQLLPCFRDFFVHTGAIATEALYKSQQRQQRMQNEQAQFKRELEQVTRTREEQLLQVQQYAQYGPAGGVNIGDMQDGNVNNGFSSLQQPQRMTTAERMSYQCYLFQRSQQLSADLQVLDVKYGVLIPRLQHQEQLVRALNRVLETVNTFGGDYAQQWNDFIDQEAEFTTEWRQSAYEYNERYLAFRVITRQGVELLLRDFDRQMRNYYTMSFVDLRTKQQDLLKAAGEKFARHRKMIGDARMLVDIGLTAIAGNKLDEVAQETEQVATATFEVIKVKDQLHKHEYEHEMQQLLTVFLGTLSNVLDKVVGDPNLTDYLSFLDVVCLEHNKLGDAPCAKTIQQQLIHLAKDHGLSKVMQDAAQRAQHVDALGCGPLAQLNWIGLVEFPAEAMTSRLNSESQFERQRAEQAARNRVLSNEPAKVQKEADRDIHTRSNWQRFVEQSKSIEQRSEV